LGVVFGDIGTSPLYAFRETLAACSEHGVALETEPVLGLLSLIVWTLFGVVSFKYAWFILSADNDGEGGILALTALVREVANGAKTKQVGIPVVLLLGICGMSLFLSDGVITPAISILSALEGLEVASPHLVKYSMPLALVLLVGLFATQRIGTGRIGALFGPVVLVWFTTLGILGIGGIVQHPGVLAALDPTHAIRFLFTHGGTAFPVLGAVFLVATGAEALYADLGHFGARAIRLAWWGVALPGLLLNYFGQAALTLAQPDTIDNPLFHLAPDWFTLPLLVLATVTTIVASQAVITGAFSMAQQAVMLGLTPRLEIRHTSAAHIGQVYVPLVNWMLMIGTVALVLSFRTSANIASAYGLAVVLTMLTTTVLLGIYLRKGRKWAPWRVALLIGPLMLVDLAFVASNSTKILSGGWLPLLIGVVASFVLITWYRGQSLLRARSEDVGLSEAEFLTSFERSQTYRCRGTAVMVTRLPAGVPRTFLHLLKHTKSMHELVVLVTIQVVRRPRVAEGERILVQRFRDDFYRVTARYGFMDSPDLPALIKDAHRRGLIPEVRDPTYILGRLTLTQGDKPSLKWFPRGLFFFLFHNAHEVNRYFGIPPSRTIEIGAPQEI